MKNKCFLYKNIACLVTNEGVAAVGGVRPKEEHLGLVVNGAVAFSSIRGILWTGNSKNTPNEFKRKPWIPVDCKGLVAYPGLVDPHTHLAFSGDRSKEFEMRMQGAHYSEIAAAGGGILSSMRSTRSESLAALTRKISARLETSFDFGVRLLEAKSGYGLNPASELKSLLAIRNAAKQSSITVVSTCLAAHAIPPEHKENRSEYIREIVETILPAVKKKKLADYVDVFCDAGFFSAEETQEVFSMAKRMGFSLRVHGEELACTGIAEIATHNEVHSVDHLLKVSDKGIRAMADHGTVGILLPGTSFYLREPAAPARKLIEWGVPVALATDFNPGTCPTQNLPFIGTLAAVQLGMTTAEIIAALTWCGARSLRREKEFGCLQFGFKGSPVFCEGDHPSALFYQIAPSRLIHPTKRK